ncbi:MAG: Gfo/Idh/MocA family oxidoreductase [Oscillospiraceae bacterium]|nr:Gfo/Idh/MocA family oxidoreductase [Oscillospiraceae bacterium]
MSDKIKMAVVGYGGMGNWHTEKILDRDDFILGGIWDIKEERRELARSKGIFVYDSFDAVLADDELELITIATWNDEHKPLAIAAMKAGKNVVCEKPVTMSMADLNDMIACSEKTGKLFTVHQNRRWDDDYLTAKKVVDDNTLGKVFRIESRVHGSRGIPGDWRAMKKHGGGMLLDWGIHLLDQILFMNENNPIISVFAQLTGITNDECDDGCYVTMIHENGLTSYVEVATNNFISLPRWYVLGENGSSIIKSWDIYDSETVLVYNWENLDAVPISAGQGLTKTMAPRTDDTIKTVEMEPVRGDLTEYYQNIYNVIRNGEEQLIKHWQLRRSMTLIESIFESSAKNEVIHVRI